MFLLSREEAERLLITETGCDKKVLFNIFYYKTAEDYIPDGLAIKYTTEY